MTSRPQSPRVAKKAHHLRKNREDARNISKVVLTSTTPDVIPPLALHLGSRERKKNAAPLRDSKEKEKNTAPLRDNKK